MSEKYFPLKDEAWEDEMYSEIHVGDTVWYRDSSGAVSKGRAMLRGPAGWVIKSQYRGTPQVVQEDENYLGHKSVPPVSYTHLTLPTNREV